MKNVIYVCLSFGLLFFLLSILSKYAFNLIAGIGPGGYLIGCTIFLLFGMNLALLALLDK